ncbi:MAG: lipopolysaccharide ABC transporter ATP-binding protein [Methanocella sp. PtaU1.Bin125]|nr:MAG: lipopolysaccharide ABC transporter ATP-binding protein [Methanocella sp. PtaU1.Bin125]
MFLDEPTNGLDPEGVIQFREIIRELAGKGKTVFFSSHIIGEVQHVCHTIGIISKGRIVAHGTPDEIRHRMRKDDEFTIKVQVTGSPMPKLSDPRIVSAVYNNGSAVVSASADIRENISEELFRGGIRVKELTLVEKSLEDLFLETIYRGETS